MAEPYYQDDSVTLYLGDCLEIDTWLKADVLVTDPPYGRSWRQGELRGHARNAVSSEGISGDADTHARDDVLRRWGGSRVAIVFGDLMLPPPTGTKLTGVYQKDATCGLRGAIAGIRRDAEAVYLLGPWSSGIGGRTSVFATRRQITGAHGLVATFGGHPHTKPGDVMEQLVDMCPAGIVADPFSGSGSTLIAARNLGRKAIGVEIEERYCELIAKRLDQLAFDFGAGA